LNIKDLGAVADQSAILSYFWCVCVCVCACGIGD
jgi:hypothetical protein